MAALPPPALLCAGANGFKALKGFRALRGLFTGSNGLNGFFAALPPPDLANGFNALRGLFAGSKGLNGFFPPPALLCDGCGAGAVGKAGTQTP